MRAREAGCVDFLPKPVRADVLFARLQRYTRVRFVSPIENGEMGTATTDLDRPRRCGGGSPTHCEAANRQRCRSRRDR